MSQLLQESSGVAKRRLPHMCVAELTSQVVCKPTTTRRPPPQHKRNSADRKQQASKHDHGSPVIVVQPDIKAIFRQVGRVFRQERRIIVLARPNHKPAAGNEDHPVGPTFDDGSGESPPRRSVPLRALTRRRQRKSTPDPTDPEQEDRDRKTPPAETAKRGYRTDMENGECDIVRPIDFLGCAVKTLKATHRSAQLCPSRPKCLGSVVITVATPFAALHTSRRRTFNG
jgi:hypothetical protein